MFRSVAIGLGLCLATVTSQAALLSRANGQAYYDTTLDITWVADANLSQTLGYSGTGELYLDEAQTWIASLNTSNYLGVNNWRLPRADVNADTTIIDCSADTEVNCRDDEMGYMYWQNLVTATSPNPFTNVQSMLYWSGTEFAPSPALQWTFHFSSGNQYPLQGSPFYAWAVAPGDYTMVPPPPAAFVFGSALGLLGLRRKRTSL